MDIDEERFDKLKQRAKSSSKLSEEEKWEALYQVLFPDDEVIPGPCKWRSFSRDPVLNDNRPKTMIWLSTFVIPPPS